MFLLCFEVEMGWDYRGDDEEELVADEEFLHWGGRVMKSTQGWLIAVAGLSLV